MSKEKEFKKIFENWESWLNEQAPRRAGDVVDPDDPTSGYIRTKSGDVKKIASMPRPDDEIAKTTSDPEAAGEKALIKRQQKLGKKYRDPIKYEKEAKSAMAVMNTIKDVSEKWNGNPVTSLLFKIPGYKGAEGYSWGNFAVDAAILGLSFIPASHALGFLARAGDKTSKAFNSFSAGSAVTQKANGLILAMAAKNPRKIGALIQKAGAATGTTIAQKPAATALAGLSNATVNALNSGKKVKVPIDKTVMAATIKAAKAKGTLDKLKADKGFMAAYTALKGA